LERVITLAQALQLADDSSTEAALFLPADVEWTLDTPCFYLEIDRFEDREIPPPFALQHGLSRVISMDQIQDIVSNARQQIINPTPEQLLSAFLFYYDRDAFINFGSI
jgi:hypothetical protein